MDQELYDALNGIITVNGFDRKHPSGQLFQSLVKLDSFKQRNTGSMERAADCAYTGQVFLLTGPQSYYGICLPDRICDATAPNCWRKENWSDGYRAEFGPRSLGQLFHFC
ncbi:MAG: hypothetical protein ACXWT3_10345 [Methylococcaceae bacterium]